MAKYGSAKYGLSLYGSGIEHPYKLTSGKLMWMVQVDWEQSGAFAGAIEPQAIRSLKIVRGRSRRLRADGMGQLQPGDERFVIEIHDPLARYDSFNTSSPIYSWIGAPGLVLRVLMVSTTSKAQAEPVFVGTLLTANYDDKTQLATLSGVGLSRKLEIGLAASLYSACQSISLGACDKWFVADGTTPFPVNYWKGRTGGLYLSECVGIVLAKAGWGLGVSYGGTVYHYEQPDYFYLDGCSAWDALVDLADGFAARLFFERDGELFVMDCLDTVGLDDGLPAPARAQQAEGLLRQSPFETLRNRVEVLIRPHSVAPFKSPFLDTYYLAIWTNNGPIAVLPNSYVDLDIKYPETAGKPLQGSFVRVNQDRLTEIYPHQVWSSADKTGTNMGISTGNSTGEFSLITQVYGANEYGLTYVQNGNNQKFCTVRLRNWSVINTAYFFNLQVQAIGVFETGESMIKVLEDLTSQASNGKRVMVLNSRWLQSQSMAADIGQAYLDALSLRESASVASVVYQWSADVLYQNLLDYDLGSHVDFGLPGSAGSLANFGLNGRWLIVGQEITWMSPDGQDAFVKLTYEKAYPVSVPVVYVMAGGVNSTTGIGVSSMTWSHTITYDANRLLLVSVSKRAFAGAEVGSITYGGVALTKVGSSEVGVGNYSRVELWSLVAPAVGTANVVLTLAGSVDWMEAGSIDFKNVHQASPLGAFTPNDQGVNPASVTVAAAVGDLVVDCLGYSAGSAATMGAGQTGRWAGVSASNWRGAGSTKPGAASVVLTWTLPVGAAWSAGFGIAVKAAA